VKNYTIELPLFTGGTTRVLKSGKTTKPTKKHWLTMNNYRNWHYQTASKTKIDFKQAIAGQVLMLPDLTALWGRIRLDYVLYPPDKRRRDLMNATIVIDKYFQDALVELGRLQDDDCSIISTVSCNYGNVDKARPRMEVTISPYSPSKP
jgi:Holliday junction resolvase RusA-like endonuclease